MPLTLIRHAQSVANAGGITQPHDTIPLSDLGLAQAQALATRWPTPPVALWVSKFLRAQQTAAPLCERFQMTAQVHPDLHEFSVIDEAQIAGLDGAQRKPFVKAYWDDPDPQRRLGTQADTFAEFDARVGSFRSKMHELPDHSVLFGHGIWFALLFWQLQGHRVFDGAGMVAFRDYQLQLTMPNCAVFRLTRNRQGTWRVESHQSQAHVESL